MAERYGKARQLLQLPPGEVHVWRAGLARSPEETERLGRSLSPDERQRAARFVFERHARRFRASRGILRTLLGRYLQTPPQEIGFRYSAQGKPALASGADLHFNVAHSHEVALYALARDRPVGIDVERCRPLDDAEGIARRFFSPREVRGFLAAGPQERIARFFQIWTRKEAIVKALGEGLSHPLHTFDVLLDDGRAVPLVSLPGDETATSQWRLLDLAPHPDYAGALAAAGDGWQVRYWEFEA